jgi:hypothetical protein
MPVSGVQYSAVEATLFNISQYDVKDFLLKNANIRYHKTILLQDNDGDSKSTCRND